MFYRREKEPREVLAHRVNESEKRILNREHELRKVLPEGTRKEKSYQRGWEKKSLTRESELREVFLHEDSWCVEVFIELGSGRWRRVKSEAVWALKTGRSWTQGWCRCTKIGVPEKHKNTVHWMQDHSSWHADPKQMTSKVNIWPPSFLFTLLQCYRIFEVLDQLVGKYKLHQNKEQFSVERMYYLRFSRWFRCHRSS